MLIRAVFVAVILLVRAHVPAQDQQQSTMTVGTNLTAVSDWMVDYPFVDEFKRARTWNTRNADLSGPWDSQQRAAIPLDANGYVTRVPFPSADGQTPQIVHTVIINFLQTGKYQFRYTGTGRMRLLWPGGNRWIDATGGSGIAELEFKSREGNFHLEIHTSDPSDYLRNFELLPPDCPPDYIEQPFRSDWLAMLEPFDSIRFMDWAETNGSPLVSWNNRTTTASYTQARHEGVALEYMIALANELDADPWICIPAKADDDYLRRCAQLIHNQLKPGRTLYLEYSNETWNSAGPFSQTIHVQDRGVELNLAKDRWRAGQLYCGMRSAQIWKIFEVEFGGGDRLINVLATQAVNVGITETRLEALNDASLNSTGTRAEALAIAPYFGRGYTSQRITTEGYPSADDIVTTVSQSIIENSRGYIRRQKALADANGMTLIAYEGGQHFVGVGPAVNDDKLTQILVETNRDPRMYDRYREYLAMLQEEGVTHFSNFSFIYKPNKWGSWGIKEYHDQPSAEAPKFRAIIDFIRENAIQ